MSPPPSCNTTGGAVCRQWCSSPAVKPLPLPFSACASPHPLCLCTRLSDLPPRIGITRLARVLSGAAEHRRHRRQHPGTRRTQVGTMGCVGRRPSPLILLLLLAGGCCALGIRVDPSPFQLAPDTPAPAEPTPTRASHHLDLCEGQPCLNGGVCLALPPANDHWNTFEYTCSCSQGFTGRNCEVRTYQLSILSLLSATGLVYKEREGAAFSLIFAL